MLAALSLALARPGRAGRARHGRLRDGHRRRAPARSGSGSRSRRPAPLLVGLSSRIVPSWAGSDTWAVAGSVALGSLAAFGFQALIRRTWELRAAQQEVSRLAAERERMRIARDLHDLLGHSLTAASVKAQLAGRLVGRDDPARAAAEIGDVERLTRQVLADVRAAVGRLPRGLARGGAGHRPGGARRGRHRRRPARRRRRGAGRAAGAVRLGGPGGRHQRGPALAGVPGARSGSRRRRSRSSTTGAAGPRGRPGSGLAGLADGPPRPAALGRSGRGGYRLERGPADRAGLRAVREPAAPTPGWTAAPAPSATVASAATRDPGAARRRPEPRPGRAGRAARRWSRTSRSSPRSAAATRWSPPPGRASPTWPCSTSRCPAWTASRPPPRCGPRCPRSGSLILTTFGRPGYLRRAMEAGALGFVVKDAPADELAEAVRRVAAGLRVVDPTLAAARWPAGPAR